MVFKKKRLLNESMCNLVFTITVVNIMISHKLEEATMPVYTGIVVVLWIVWNTAFDGAMAVRPKTYGIRMRFYHDHGHRLVAGILHTYIFFLSLHIVPLLLPGPGIGLKHEEIYQSLSHTCNVSGGSSGKIIITLINYCNTYIQVFHRNGHDVYVHYVASYAL